MSEKSNQRIFETIQELNECLANLDRLKKILGIVDTEKQEMLEIIPNQPHTDSVVGYFQVPAPNCYVCKSKSGDGRTRLEIYPVGGGWLGTFEEHLSADVAPFHG